MYYIKYIYNAINYNILVPIEFVYHVSSMGRRTLDYRSNGPGSNYVSGLTSHINCVLFIIMSI